MLDRLPAPTPNDDCDDKNGFFPPGFIDQVREIMKKYVMQELSAIGEGASSSQFSAGNSLTDLLYLSCNRPCNEGSELEKKNENRDDG